MKFLLLGNGFDLHHGLPTRYIDMIRIFRHLTENSDVHYKTVGDILDSYFKSPAAVDESNLLSKYYRTYDKGLHEVAWASEFSWAELAQNWWYQYFCSTDDRDLTWIDFELEIQKALEDVERACSGGRDDSGVRVLLFSGRWASKEEFISFLYEELCFFKKAMCEYLHYFVDDMLPQLKASATVDFVKKAELIVTLNYTSTFEKLYISKNQCNLHRAMLSHYHGKVADKEKIVVGINSNESDEYCNGNKPNTAYICFKKYYQRILYDLDRSYMAGPAFIRTSKQNDMNKMKEKNVGGTCKKWIKERIEKDELFVMGHSLNESDADLIKDLFSRCTKISVYYHDLKALGDYICNLTKIFGRREFENMRQSSKLIFRPLGDTKPAS